MPRPKSGSAPTIRVPKLKAEKEVSIGSTTSGSPAQAPAERKKRVLTEEQKAKARANLVKAREAKKAMGGFSSAPERESYNAMLGKTHKKAVRSFKKGLDAESRQVVEEGVKASRADVKEMRDIAKGYMAVAKKHRMEAKEAMDMAKQLRAKAKSATSLSKAGKKAFYRLPGDQEFQEGIQFA